MNQRDPRTYAIIGAAMEVHRHLGHGFLEAVYQEALAFEFTIRQISFRREVDLPILYKGKFLVTHYRADFMCYDSIIVECKALTRLAGYEEAQLMNYMKSTEIEVGLLLNFGTPSLEYKRFALSALKSAKSAKSAD
jgi:GxxExxY protein